MEGLGRGRVKVLSYLSRVKIRGSVMGPELDDHIGSDLLVGTRTVKGKF